MPDAAESAIEQLQLRRKHKLSTESPDPNPKYPEMSTREKIRTFLKGVSNITDDRCIILILVLFQEHPFQIVSFVDLF
jgi:hypothetical protein